ncbi:MAG: TlpA disulfide reductase family protein [Desulfococcaceae bacterium]
MKKLRLWLPFFLFLPLFLPLSHAEEAKNPVKKITLDEFKKLVSDKTACFLVTVTASWCGPCKEELPDLVRLNRKYRDQGIRVIGLSVDYAGPEAMQPVIDQYHVDFPVYWAGEAAIEAFGISGIPLLLFFRDGTVTERIVGKHPENVVEEKLAAFLSGKKQSH